MELCPKCKLATYIKGTYTQVEGDDSSDIPTKVYTVVEQACRNPQCENYQRVVASERQQIYPAQKQES